uniref:protein angel homolog 1-like n=1 Tax=Doryrhamphus excisus TaxID=161450 RepID=UPI0025AEC7AB|nr:protein angel homolog 1-like [Doryrhamphus excisus]
MIGCLLFYILYPLSRHLFSKRPAESTKRSRSSAAVNGKAAYDSAAITTRMFTQFQKHLLDLCLQQRCGSMGQKEERISKERSSEDEKVPDAEELITVTQQVNETHVRHTEEPMKTHKLKASNPVENTGQETECWDEYLVPAADGTPMMLARAQINHRDDDDDDDDETGWHFPTGPGSIDEVHRPLWRFPAVSYYPSLEPTEPFEVMWRVWRESEADYPMIPFTRPSMDFTVMSYNILAQDLLEANMELYKHCRLEVLDWDYRCNVLLEEIGRWEPDILCLQEVQENHYDTHLCPVLTQMGYNCAYKKRTGNKTDGCATCYRNNRFSEVSVTLIEFFRPEIELLDRHNVGIVLLLRPRVRQGSKVSAMGSLLCVANTHLLFNPSRGDVKLAQLAIMLAEIDSVVASWKAKGEHCNVVLCGDFNSVPHAPLYRLVTTGELYFQGVPAWMVSGQKNLSHKSACHRLFPPLWPSSLGISNNCQYVTANQDESHSPGEVCPGGKLQYSHHFLLRLRFCPASCIRPSDLQVIPGVTDNTPDMSSDKQPYVERFGPIIRHQLDLESVYQHNHSEVTTLHSEGGATVDYIFYSPERILTSDQAAGGNFGSEGLKLVGCLSLLSGDALWSMEGLPNHTFPSDHLSLLAKLRLDLNAPS